MRLTSAPAAAFLAPSYIVNHRAHATRPGTHGTWRGEGVYLRWTAAVSGFAFAKVMSSRNCHVPPQPRALWRTLPTTGSFPTRPWHPGRAGKPYNHRTPNSAGLLPFASFTLLCCHNTYLCLGGDYPRSATPYKYACSSKNASWASMLRRWPHVRFGVKLCPGQQSASSKPYPDWQGGGVQPPRVYGTCGVCPDNTHPLPECDLINVGRGHGHRH